MLEHIGVDHVHFAASSRVAHGTRTSICTMRPACITPIDTKVQIELRSY